MRRTPSRGQVWAGLGLTLALAAPLPWLRVSRAAPVPAPAAPDPRSVRVNAEDFLSGLDDPVALAAPRDGSGRLFVAERAGRIRMVKNGVVGSRPFLDLSDRVDYSPGGRGLLGLAIHPQFARNGLLVVSYTARQPAGELRYARFSVSPDPDVADAASERRLLGWPHPRPENLAGDLAFGPDGYLYLATDDGGGVGDPDGNGQNPATLLGKMLRLDIDGGEPYRVPDDNPFVATAGHRPEIWALGLRSPWRFGFDRGTGDLYLGDRGQSQYEEVNYQPAASAGGENYGWNIMEGIACVNGGDCDKSGKVLPVERYVHIGACVAVVGGTVYRGTRFPELTGLYVYADTCLSAIIGTARNEAGSWVSAQVGQAPRSLGIQSIGEDAAGEFYLVGRDGRVMRLVSAGNGMPTPGTPFPTRPPRPPTPTPTPSERTVDIAAIDFAYRPATLRAAVDEVLVVRLANQGTVPHEIVFELDDFRTEASDRVPPGQQTELSFYAPAVQGRFSFYCSVDDHRERGMAGTLLVGPCPDGCRAYLPRLQR